MKRTRRIEIIRYSSHVTSGSGDGEAAPDGAETSATDILLEALGVLPQAPEALYEGERAEGDVAPPAPRPSGLLRLPDWLRKG